MDEPSNKPYEEFPTPADLQSWLRQEIKDLAKAYELRMMQATQLVSDYAIGKLTKEQADDAFSLYSKRWPEPLPGVNIGPPMTDDEIVKKIDAAQEVIPRHVIREITRRQLDEVQEGKNDPFSRGS